jgi:hypothetical protein
LSQRGVQPRGNRLSETMTSASEQARVNGTQSICVADRVASTRHSFEPLRRRATQESLEQALNGRAASAAGSPSKPDASATSERT